MKGFLLGAAALIALQTHDVSAQNVAGTYTIDYATRTVINGEQSETAAKIKLVLEVKGDSVFGTWQMTAPREGPGQQLRGTASGKTVKLYGSSSARIRGMGDEQSVAIRQEYSITIDGDDIKGEIIAHPPAEMNITMQPRPFSGKREK